MSKLDARKDPMKVIAVILETMNRMRKEGMQEAPFGALLDQDEEMTIGEALKMLDSQVAKQQNDFLGQHGF